ncbi:lipocalin family protein [Thiomicrospira sp. WB1]|uniref:lipocalin family protein n=1 Tax=Thiomicrospira sp. WB1 TaxID=1685380 RepID=UPI00074A9C62|nr:lipocalin family protein [Thiomicrospira sp. WB1]KUJ71081.1 lipocalin [Thiomicrospira sp. WB1]
MPSQRPTHFLPGLVMLISLLLSGCTQLPKGVTPIKDFELTRYLGTWHEIARLDHSFENDLMQVTATYSLREDGGVRVLNRGWNTVEKQWEEAEGKAYFVETPDVGRLKVSFFGPFYGGYNIHKLSPDYDMALVIGPSKDYAWLLARSQQPPAAQCERFLKAADQLGIARDDWIEVNACG